MSTIPLLSQNIFSFKGGRQTYQIQKNDNTSIKRKIIIMTLIIGIVMLLFYQIIKGSIKIKDDVNKHNNRNFFLEKPKKVGQLCYTDGPHLKTPSKISERHIIVFDAGSTGTRVHVYKFQYCGLFLEGLVGETLYSEVKPGLSHYEDDPMSAGGSILPLLEDVKRQISPSCTPISLKATAGLRLLEDDKVEQILHNVKSSLSILSPQDSHHHTVSVIDGKEEAVGAWITVNFLQNRLHLSKKPMMSSVVLDLGGGSTQIVFASDSVGDGDGGDSLHMEEESSNYHTFHLFGNKITLYQQSYLGFGMMEARKRIKASLKGESSLCFGDLDSCLSLIKKIFFSSKHHCPIEPCSFDGIHQPIIHPSQPLIALSYFYDRIKPLLKNDPNKEAINHHTTLRALIPLARAACLDPSRYHGESEEVKKHSCMDLSYIISLLRDGYGIQMDHDIQVEKQIAGYEMGWSLGAALQMLDTSKESIETCLGEDLL